MEASGTTSIAKKNMIYINVDGQARYDLPDSITAPLFDLRFLDISGSLRPPPPCPRPNVASVNALSGELRGEHTCRFRPKAAWPWRRSLSSLPRALASF